MSHHVGSSSSSTPPSNIQFAVDAESLEMSFVDNKRIHSSNTLCVSSNHSDSNNCSSSKSNDQALLSTVTRTATIPDSLIIDMDQSHCRTLLPDSSSASHVDDTRTSLYYATNHEKYNITTATTNSNHNSQPSSSSLTDTPLQNRLDGSQMTKESLSVHSRLYQSDTAHIYSSTMDTLCGIDTWPSDNEENEHVHEGSYQYQVSLDSSTTPTESWPLRDKCNDDGDDDVISTSLTLSKYDSSHKLTSDTFLTPPVAIPRKKLNIAPPIRPHRQSNRTTLTLPATIRMTIVSSSNQRDTHEHGLAAKNNSINSDNNLSTSTNSDDQYLNSDNNNHHRSSSSNSNSDSDAANHINDSVPTEPRITINMEDRSTITPWDVDPSAPPPPPTQPGYRPSTSTLESSNSYTSHASFVWPRPMTWYRRTAFQAPYDPFFFGTWFFTATIVGIFEAFTVRLLSSDVRIGFQIGFAGLVILTILAMLYTTTVDTEDPVVREARESGVRRDINYRLRRGVTVRDSRGQCRVCCVFTASSTRHCKLCNKCVAIHDHHCRWLNCCIGHTNYWSFCVTVIASIITALMMISISCYLLALAGLNHSLFARNAMFTFNYYSKPDTEFGHAYAGGVAVCCLQLFFTMLFVIPLLHLLIFHIRLWILGMTTSVFLTERRYSRERTRISWRRCEPAHHSSTAASASSSVDTTRNPWTQHIPRRTRFRRTLYR